MKRNKNLQSLSRDHHHGLLLGWKVRQGLKNNIDEKIIADYIIYFSDQALIPHFKEEEELLLKYLPADNAFKHRVFNEHGEILNRVGQLRSNVPLDQEMLLKIAELLDTHIRFEERELFPYLESTLSPQQLEEAGAAIEEIHQPFIEQFYDEFWNAG